MYGVNLQPCYWTVAKDETPSPTRRGHRLDNPWRRDLPAGACPATVKFPESARAANVYPIAILKGQKVLSQAGFANP